MIKKNCNLIKYGYTDENGNYHCEWQEVIDEAATAAAEAACEAKWQGEADACQEQIDQYEALKSEINTKQNEAASLRSDFKGNSNAMAEANITHEAARDSMSACFNCLDKLDAAYESMIKDCENQIDEFTAKKEEAQSKHDECKGAAENKRYKWACV